MHTVCTLKFHMHIDSLHELRDVDVDRQDHFACTRRKHILSLMGQLAECIIKYCTKEFYTELGISN